MSYPAFGFLLPLHMIFMATALVGGILFIIWAMRLKQAELLKVIKWVLVVGLLGVILTCIGFFGTGMHSSWYGKNMPYRMGPGMMDDIGR